MIQAIHIALTPALFQTGLSVLIEGRDIDDRLELSNLTEFYPRDSVCPKKQPRLLQIMA